MSQGTRLRVQRRKLQARVALLEAEKQGWQAEKARLVTSLEGNRVADGSNTKER